MTTPSPGTAGPAPLLMALRILVGSLMSGLVFITIALWFVLESTEGTFDVTLGVLVPVVLGVLSHGASLALGYRAPAIAPGTPREQAEETSRTAFQAATILRFALSEVVAIVGIAAAFVLPSGGFTTYLVGALVSLGLIWWHCWPDERVFTTMQRVLERDGGTSYLREAYGKTPLGGGAVERL